MRDELRILLDMKVKGLEKVDQLSKKFGMMNVKLNKGGKMIDANTGRFISHEQVLQRNITATNKMNKILDKQQKRFDMNTLSWMFGGMALQRVGLMMTRFFIPSMDKLNKLNTEGSKKVLGMVAAFEFLKISIFETLAQTPLFQNFVEWIIKGAIWISEFVQKHDGVVAMAAAISGAAVALGTIAIGVGIFKQLSHLLLLMGFNEAGATTGSGVMGAISKIGGALLVGWSIKMILEDVLDADFDLFENALNATMLGIGLKMLGAGWAMKAGVWVFAILTVIDIILDPSGFGKFVVNVANWTTKTIETVGEIFAAFLQTIVDIFAGRGFTMGRFDEVLGNWFDDFREGMKAEVMKLESEGKLSEVMEFYWRDEIAKAKLEPIDMGSLIQWTTGGEAFAIDPTAMSKSTEQLNILANKLPNTNALLLAMSENITKVDDALITHSFVPSMELLNTEFQTNIDLTGTLNEMYPILTEQTNNQAAAVDSLAESYIELASAIREWISAKEEKTEYQSSLTG